MQTTIEIRSETNAQQVKRLLQRQHLAFESRKQTTSSGCTTVFRTAASPEVIRELLRQHRIPFEIL